MAKNCGMEISPERSKDDSSFRTRPSKM
jgi:hypothetical protein